jgi:hypothetical protein
VDLSAPLARIEREKDDLLAKFERQIKEIELLLGGEYLATDLECDIGRGTLDGIGHSDTCARSDGLLSPPVEVGLADIGSCLDDVRQQ